MKIHVSLLALIGLLLCVLAFDLPGTRANKAIVLASEQKLSSTSVLAQQRRVGFQRCDLMHQEVKDLSGQYKGELVAEQQTFKDAILTIDKERFSLKTNSGTFSGILSAVKTCAYTAVALKIEDANVVGNWQNMQNMEGHSISLKATRNSGTFTLESTDSNVPFKFQCDCTKCKHECDCCPGLRLLP